MALNSALKSVSKTIIDFIEEGDRSLADGWQWKDALNFMDEAFALPGAAKNAPEAWKAIKDGLSDEDMADYVEFIKDELETVHEDAEQKAEAVITWISQTERLYRLFAKKKVA